MRAAMVVPGTMPGLNEYVREMNRSRYDGARMKRRETERARLCALGLPYFPGRVRVLFTWVERDRRRDPDNVAFAKKFVFDGLVAAGVIQNDSPRYVAGFEDRFAVDPGNPRVEVTVVDAE